MSKRAYTADPPSLRELRVYLRARLQARRSELEQVTLARVFAVSETTAVAEPAYVDGLRAAVLAAIDYGFDVVEHGEESAPPVPAALLTQARVAACSGVSLDSVLRRYFAGYTLLCDFLVEEVETDGGLRSSGLKQVLRTQAVLFDRLLLAVSEEYGREEGTRRLTVEQRRAERVERLLAGELVDTSDLAYDLEATHVGVLAVGPGAGETIRDLANDLDCRLLLVSRPESTVWAWFGARRQLDPLELISCLDQGSTSPGAALALGEPTEGLEGWRLTHRQAAAALPIVLRTGESVVRYADVGLLAAVLQNDLFATSLRRLYLEPLERERGGGATARQTLRAYFAAGRNVSSAAAALGVKRHTVTNRLRAIELAIGRPLDAATVELATALRLDDLAATLARRDE